MDDLDGTEDMTRCEAIKKRGIATAGIGGASALNVFGDNYCGRNMNWVLHSIDAGQQPHTGYPEREPRVSINFIR